MNKPPRYGKYGNAADFREANMAFSQMRHRKSVLEAEADMREIFKKSPPMSPEKVQELAELDAAMHELAAMIMP